MTGNGVALMSISGLQPPPSRRGPSIDEEGCCAKTGNYTRCRVHGGASTGPRTAAGLERCRRARWKDGHRSAAATAELKHSAEEARQVWAELRHLEMLLRLHRRPAAGGS